MLLPTVSPDFEVTPRSVLQTSSICMFWVQWYPAVTEFTYSGLEPLLVTGGQQEFGVKQKFCSLNRLDSHALYGLANMQPCEWCLVLQDQTASTHYCKALLLCWRHSQLCEAAHPVWKAKIAHGCLPLLYQSNCEQFSPNITGWVAHSRARSRAIC